MCVVRVLGCAGHSRMFAVFGAIHSERVKFEYYANVLAGP